MKNPQTRVSISIRALIPLAGALFYCGFLTSCHYNTYPSSYYRGYYHQPTQTARSYVPVARQAPASAIGSAYRTTPQNFAPAPSTTPRFVQATAPQQAYYYQQQPYQNPAYARWNTGRGWQQRLQSHYQNHSFNARGAGEAWRERTRGTRLQPNASTISQAPMVSVAHSSVPSSYATTGYNQRATTWQQVPQGQAQYVSQAPVGRSYQVMRGDTLMGIARTQQVSVEALRYANQISGDIIHEGTVLLIPR